MTIKNTQKYRDSLQKMANHLGVSVASLTDQATTPTGGESAGGLSNAPMHLADIGSEAYSQELAATLLENEAYLSHEVAAAMDRLDGDTYGTCERCHKNIGSERLEALPYARHCVKCAERVQSGRNVSLNDGRPKDWLGTPGHESVRGTNSRARIAGHELGSVANDVHAAGTPGGGSAVGGLAGTTIGSGSPRDANLEQAAGGIEVEPQDEADDEQTEAYAGITGGAVGGSPANKRTRGGKSVKANSQPKTSPTPRRNRSA